MEKHINLITKELKENNMKKFILFVSLLCMGIVFAQSDLETTQKFKSQSQQIDEAVKNAQSNDDLDAAQRKLDQLQKDFQSHKTLLDKSLYPDDFNKVIAKLGNAIELRRGDFIQISELKTEVAGLQDQITELNTYNTDLIRKIRILDRAAKRDAKSIDSLKTLVKSLRASLRERDNLVYGIVDSLLSEFVNNPAIMTDQGVQGVIAKIDQKNMFGNVRQTVTDNIKFLEVTVLTPEDYNEIKEQQKKFSSTWRKIGPKIADVYLKKQDRSAEIAQINNLFAEWNYRIDKKIWNSVNTLFRSKNIKIQNFDQGMEFTYKITSFIDDEIKNSKIKDREEILKTYQTFTDSVWFGPFQEEWITLLLDNKLMTEAQKDTIESRIAKWKETVDPDAIPKWIYFVIGGVIILAFAFLFFQNKKSKSVE